MSESAPSASVADPRAEDSGAPEADIPAVRMHGVCKTFGTNRVLDGFEIEIQKGEVFTVLGPSGCGKSVTLKLIMGLLEADAGEIWIQGTRIDSMTQAELAQIRRKLGMVFQSGALFDSLTVEENVGFALQRHTDLSPARIREIVEEKLLAVGLQGILHKLPSQLSGGMRKRVSLARAIAFSPEILLWDEPTTGLDPVMTSEIDRLIQMMRNEHGVTSLVVTHDMKSAFRVSDRVAVHYQGKLVETNTPEGIQSSEHPLVHQFIQGLLEGPLKVRQI